MSELFILNTCRLTMSQLNDIKCIRLHEIDSLRKLDCLMFMVM